MKTRDERPFENQNADREPDQRDRAAGCDRQTDVARAEHGPEKNRTGHDRQRDEDRHRPFRDATLRIVSHQ